MIVLGLARFDRMASVWYEGLTWRLIAMYPAEKRDPLIHLHLNAMGRR